MNRRRSVVPEMKKDGALETSLSTELQENLRTLSLLKPFPNDTPIPKDMFIKSNVKGLFVVLNYLTAIVSPILVKKYRWPVKTTVDEKEFRNFFKEKLNVLRVKYNWKIDEVKIRLLLFPGGIDVIKMILEFTITAMKHIINENNEFGKNENTKLHEVQSKLQILEEKQKLLKPKIIKIIPYFREIKIITQKAKLCIAQLFAGLSTRPKNLNEIEDIISCIEYNLMTQVYFEVKPLLYDMKDFVKKCELIEEKTNELISRRRTNINVDHLIINLSRTNGQMNSLGQILNTKGIILDGKIDLQKLLNYFCLILPDILSKIDLIDQVNLQEIHEFSSLFDSISHKLQNLLKHLLEMKNLNEITTSSTSTGIGIIKPDFLEHIRGTMLSTPPISVTKVRAIDSKMVLHNLPEMSPEIEENNKTKESEASNDSANDLNINAASLLSSTMINQSSALDTLNYIKSKKK